MNRIASIVNGVTSQDPAAIHQEFLDAKRGIPGWSTPLHYAFFKEVAKVCTGRETRVLVCGMYHGLDMRMIGRAFKAECGMLPYLTGVDLFTDSPCADWPEEKRGLSWTEAFKCLPPSMEESRKNNPGADIVQADSVAYLAEHAHRFDFIWFDTSHDEKTVLAELAATRRSSPLKTTILAGDDYTEGGGGFKCGVATAVDSFLPNHIPLFNRIWISTAADFDS